MDVFIQIDVKLKAVIRDICHCLLIIILELTLNIPIIGDPKSLCDLTACEGLESSLVSWHFNSALLHNRSCGHRIQIFGQRLFHDNFYG